MVDQALKSSVVIIGGGVAGLSAALELAARGMDSLVVERGHRLGGRVADFCCKAGQACARCGACRVGDLLRQAAKQPRISFLTKAKPMAVEQSRAGWRLTLEPQGNNNHDPITDLMARPLGERIEVEAGAVILAVGATPFDPSGKTRFGYRRIPGVVSALDLESALDSGLAELAGGSDPKRVAFIQCVGSRDQSLGHLYCSRVCCGFALRMARVIKYRQPETEVVFFHMDVQRYGRAWEDELAVMRQEIEFVRAMPGEVVAGEGGPAVVYATGGQTQRQDFDLVVLSQGLRPPAGAAGLAELFNCARTVDGFLGTQGSSVQSGVHGLFVAGAARGPRSIVESIEHGALAACQAQALLMDQEAEAVHA